MRLPLLTEPDEHGPCYFREHSAFEQILPQRLACGILTNTYTSRLERSIHKPMALAGLKSYATNTIGSEALNAVARDDRLNLACFLKLRQNIFQLQKTKTNRYRFSGWPLVVP